MKILFINDKRHDDVKNWSGTTAHMAEMLEKLGHQVFYIDNLTGSFFLRCFYRGVMSLLTGKQVKANREPAVLKSMARRRDRVKRKYDYDLIFTPNSMCLCYLKDRKPSVLYTDATYGGMEGFYPNFTAVSARTSRYGNYHEKMALQTCSRIIYASRWAKQTAADCYGIPEEKMRVVPFGANLDGYLTEAEVEDAARNRWEQPEKEILFVGVDWERKGGPKALKALCLLRKKGWPVKLRIVGCSPSLTAEEKEAAEITGYSDKREKAGRERLRELYRKSFLFFMPSLYECAGIVYAEAAGWGLPSVAADAGGVSDIVLEGKSGRLLSADADAEAYAALLEQLLTDRDGYLELCRTAGICGRELFTWEHVGEQVDRILKEALDDQGTVH